MTHGRTVSGSTCEQLYAAAVYDGAAPTSRGPRPSAKNVGPTGETSNHSARTFDHGTDLAQTVMGLPVNMPSRAHGQGYSDLSFLIPELVAGVQFSKGPYFADQGDFATAGSSNITYATTLDRPIAHVDLGGDAYGRAVLAASPEVTDGHLLGALDVARTAASDIDYYYVSRLPGEPAAGMADIHTHPTLPRTARVSLHLGF